MEDTQYSIPDIRLCKDYIINTAIKLCIEVINNFKRSDRDNKWVNEYTKLTERKKINLITLIIKSQFLAIRDSIISKQDIHIRQLGTFKIKPQRRIYIDNKYDKDNPESIAKCKEEIDKFHALKKINKSNRIDNAEIPTFLNKSAKINA